MRVVSAAARRGQPLRGVCDGPTAIRRFLRGPQRHTTVDLEGSTGPWEDAARVAAHVEALHREPGTAPVLVLGGDHSLSAGSVAATRRVYPHSKVVWIDAHADVHTPRSSPSGNAHGMPLGALCGRMPSGFHTLDPSQLTYVGLRDVDEDEALWIDAQRRRGLRAYTVHDLRRRGVPAVVDAIRRDVASAAVHVSFDVDVLDPTLAPGTGTRVPAGLTLSELAPLLDGLAALNVVCLDVVEVNPDLDDHQCATAKLAATVAMEILGEVAA